MVGRCIKQTGSGFKDGAWEVSRESLKSFAPPLTARSPHLWQGPVALALFTRQALSHLVLDQNKSGIKITNQLNFGKRKTASDKPLALLSPNHAIDGYNVPLMGGSVEQQLRQLARPGSSRSRYHHSTSATNCSL